jgi:protein phosphatase PTC1
MKKSVKDSFIYAYKITDNELKELGADSVGTTCVNAYITKIDKQRKLYIANCGDSRAVLCHDTKAHRLSQDHKPTLKSEENRILESDGVMIQGRVNGIISLTRSLGDHNMKEWIINDPYYSEMNLTSKDKFLILACDGIWDVMTDQVISFF